MTVDSVYQVSMFVSLGERFDFACSCMEVLLTDEALTLNIPPPDIANGQTDLIEANPQLTITGHILKDTANWIELCWLYRAEGNEKHITIGNFKKHGNTEAMFLYQTPTEPNGSYYYLDDVSIEKIPYNLVNINLGEDKTVCQATLSDTLTAHGSYYTGWLWSTGDTTQSIVATQPGLYWVEASNGMCHLRDTIEIIYIDTTALSLGPDVQVCPQDFPIAITGPSHMETYQWSTGSTTDSIQVDAPGEYVLESEHACGLFMDTVLVALAVQPIQLGNDTVLCGQPIFQRTLAAPLGYDSYLWSNGASMGSIDVTTPGTYWVRAISNTCGTFSDSITIANQPFLTLDLGPDTERCIEAGFALDAGQGFDEYAWNTGATGASIEATTYGTYAVEATYACGTLSDSIAITEPPPLSVALPDDATLNLGESILIQPTVVASTPLIYSWSPADGLNCVDCVRPRAAPLLSTVYTLTVEDGHGCEATDDMAILIVNLKRVYIPSAFSPNGDGINDFFTVYGGQEVAEVASMKVFDRWGEMVFSAEHLPPSGAVGWDGMFRGKEMGQGVFTYSVELEYLNGEHERRMGDVQLVR